MSCDTACHAAISALEFQAWLQIFEKFKVKMQNTLKISKCKVHLKYQNITFFFENLQNLVRRFSQNSEVLKRFLESFLVDLEKRCKMSIHLQRSVPIQPRTSPPKFDILILWPSAQIKVKMQVFLLENLQPVRRGARTRLRVHQPFSSFLFFLSLAFLPNFSCRAL